MTEPTRKHPLAMVLNLAIQDFREAEAPTSIGYHDFALIFALAQEQLPGSPISAEFLSEYLVRHPAVPEDARLEPQGVEAYLAMLEKKALIHPHPENGYRMHEAVVGLLSANVGSVKTPDLDELAIRGISLYAALHSPFYR
ncbi:hypothetical protein HYY74_00290 [Candidatus Woesearchaeota archaeon]|nr:hypothetical protein [Candidatus Woesearchaeota archaeon]